MFTFYCIAKTEVKTKTTISLQSCVPRKPTFVHGWIECGSPKLGSSSCFIAVVFSNRLQCYYSEVFEVFALLTTSIGHFCNSNLTRTRRFSHKAFDVVRFPVRFTNWYHHSVVSKVII